MVDQKLERLSTDNKPERRPDATLDHNRHAEWLQCSGAILHWQMQRTCLAHFENMHIGEFEYQGISGLVAEYIVAIDVTRASRSP